MARKDDIDPAAPAAPAGAARALRGLANRLAAVVNHHADRFIDEALPAAPGPAPDLHKTLRTVALIARAAVSLHQLQAAEDKAEDRALDRQGERAKAAVRTLTPINPEGDETDMNDRDPRLDTPEGVAEIYEGARTGVERLFRGLEIKRADRDPTDGDGSVGAVPKLAAELPRPPAPAH
jgi:hypothetical protein